MKPARKNADHLRADPLPRPYVGTLGRPMPWQVGKLWKRWRGGGPGDGDPEPGPRSFFVRIDPLHDYSFHCDPDAPLHHLDAVVVSYKEGGCCHPIFWCYLKTKHPDKAKVLRLGWPERSAGMRWKKAGVDEEDWQIAPVVAMAKSGMAYRREFEARQAKAARRALTKT